MHVGKLVFAQLMEHLPWKTFGRIVERYGGDHRVREFSCAHQFRCMAFAQFTYRESLRDLATCLRAQSAKLYHLGLRGTVARSTLADANEARDWRIYAEFAQHLIRIARRLYLDEPFGVDLKETVYALDSTTIDLCLSVFPWAPFRSTKAAIKLHTLIDLRGNIPCFIRISDGKMHDVRALDDLLLEPGAFYIMDRGYIDFARLYVFTQQSAFFIIRGKRNMDYARQPYQSVDKSTGLRSDQKITLQGPKTSQQYPDALRRITYRDAETQKRFTFLTNNWTLPALTIARLYKCRWQVELFFKWTKQHLRIKAFYGTSQNAVKTQVWIAISVYVLVAIVKKELKLERSLYEILQILSVAPFEKTPIFEALSSKNHPNENTPSSNQLSLFDL